MLDQFSFFSKRGCSIPRIYKIDLDNAAKVMLVTRSELKIEVSGDSIPEAILLSASMDDCGKKSLT